MTSTLFGNYSGTGVSSDVATITGITGTAQNVQISWTCTATGTAWPIGFCLTSTQDTSQLVAEGVYCGTSQGEYTSDTWTFDVDSGAGGGSWVLAMLGDGTSGAWTATVSLLS